MAAPPLPDSIAVSLSDLAKMIDHSLLHPTMTDAEVLAGLEICERHDVATACVKPYHAAMASEYLTGTSVRVCPVIGFPHGNSTTDIKIAEARQAVRDGGAEIDMVVNIGKVLSEEWEYVGHEIQAINEAVVAEGAGAILKVIFENDYLTEKHIVQLCQICSDVGVAFIKTSTGYGFVKDPATGQYHYKGATLPHLALMRRSVDPKVQIKAAGGVRTLDDLLRVRALGVSRVGATATVAILEQAKKRGIGKATVEVKVPPAA